LLNSFGFTTSFASIGESDVVSVGSILQMLPEDYRGVILGSGLIWPEQRRFPHARILALRGVLTRDLLDAPGSTPLGDPGLLARRLIPKLPAKTATLGVIPHYADKRDSRITSWLERFAGEARFIDVEREPSAVLHDIASCEHVISSSLHGLICADALGVPNTWAVFSDRVVGGGFKFADYASAVGRELKPLSVSGNEPLSSLIESTSLPGQHIVDVVHSLESVFSRFRRF
jgi:pyruvyltransferase